MRGTFGLAIVVAVVVFGLSACEASLIDQPPSSVEVVLTTVGAGDLPFGPGDDPDLDRAYTACDDGDFQACDELWSTSPSGSDYEAFGATCGDHIQNEVRTFGSCEETDGGIDIPFRFGDSPELDALYELCREGALEECNNLWSASPVGTEYELFATTCGGRLDVEQAYPGECSDVASE
jgi:hypothetical protein